MRQHVTKCMRLRLVCHKKLYPQYKTWHGRISPHLICHYRLITSWHQPLQLATVRPNSCICSICWWNVRFLLMDIKWDEVDTRHTVCLSGRRPETVKMIFKNSLITLPWTTSVSCQCFNFSKVLKNSAHWDSAESMILENHATVIQIVCGIEQIWNYLTTTTRILQVKLRALNKWANHVRLYIASFLFVSIDLYMFVDRFFLSAANLI